MEKHFILFYNIASEIFNNIKNILLVCIYADVSFFLINSQSYRVRYIFIKLLIYNLNIYAHVKYCLKFTISFECMLIYFYFLKDS